MVKNICLKLFFLLISFGFLYGNNTLNLVPIANKNIDYKEQIFSYNVRLVQENKNFKCKEYLDIVTLKQNKYFAKHYIAKNRAICANNVFVPEKNTVRFKFGNLEIEKDGEVIRETDDYIRIKNLDGTIDKIYKDGRN